MKPLTTRQKKHDLLVTFNMYLRIAKRVHENKLVAGRKTPVKHSLRRSVLAVFIN
jgi:hypothetical protein